MYWVIMKMHRGSRFLNHSVVPRDGLYHGFQVTVANAGRRLLLADSVYSESDVMGLTTGQTDVWSTHHVSMTRRRLTHEQPITRMRWRVTQWAIADSDSWTRCVIDASAVRRPRQIQQLANDVLRTGAEPLDTVRFYLTSNCKTVRVCTAGCPLLPVRLVTC